MNKLKIVAISDIHGHLPEIEECDIVCIAGDISPLKIERKMDDMAVWFEEKFIRWCLELECKKVVFVAGNHDAYLWALGKDTINKIISDFGDKIVYLEDDTKEVLELKIHGSPWVPELVHWPFYANSYKLREKFALIPVDTDILITHCPPTGIKGVSVVHDRKSVANNQDFGCQELKDELDSKDYKMHHIFGHVHSGERAPVSYKGTVLHNCAIMSERYTVDRDVFSVFEINIKDKNEIS